MSKSKDRDNFEVDLSLNQGQKLSVSGLAEYYSNCDCDGRELHPHVHGLEINWDNVYLFNDKDDLEGKKMSEDEVLALFKGLDFEDLVVQEIYETERNN